MPKPVTPLVGSEVFILNERKEVLLVQRSDNGFWCLPGGAQEIHESPKVAAIRECKEETGFDIVVEDLIGIYSSACYEYVNYPWKDDQWVHLLFLAKVVGGVATTSDETKAVKWFKEDSLPELSDGHQIRINHGFSWRLGVRKVYFE